MNDKKEKERYGLKRKKKIESWRNELKATR